MARPTKHTKTGMYWYKVRVPRDLRAVVGKDIYSHTLDTKDPEEAKRRFVTLQSQKDLQHKALRAKPAAIPHKLIMEIAGETYRELMHVREQEPGEPAVWVSTLELLGRLEESDLLESWYGPTIDRRLLDRGVAADRSSRIRLIAETHGAFQQAVEQQLKRAKGDYRRDPDGERFPIPVPKASAPLVSLYDLFELWEREHLADGGAVRTVSDFKHKIDDFVAYLGHSDPNSVTSGNISDYCDLLKHERGLAGATVKNKYLTAIRTIYRTGLGKSKISADPTATVRVSITKAIRERPKGFTDDEAIQILRQALVAVDMPGRTATHNKLAYRWVPWICAYTGARGGEVAQLRREDLVEEYGIQCLRITPEAGTVKTGQYRLVPLHSHLVEMGLPEFIASCPAGPLFYMPNSRPRKDGHTPAAAVRGKVGAWVRQIAGITDKRLQPNHAWRHRFTTVARNVDIGTPYMRAIQGHSDGSASGDYGEYQMKALHREIEKLPRYVV